jgi:hypothetical protein
VVRLGGDEVAGWQRLTVTAAEGGDMPGWWRRLGHFVLTVAADTELAPPDALDEVAWRLEEAEPRHTWMRAPLTDP